jgi:hypothetical protein
MIGSDQLAAAGAVSAACESLVVRRTAPYIVIDGLVFFEIAAALRSPSTMLRTRPAMTGEAAQCYRASTKWSGRGCFCLHRGGGICYTKVLASADAKGEK